MRTNKLEREQKFGRLGYRLEEGALPDAVPDLPFKTNWQELVAKRLMQLAADRGVSRIAWYNGDQVGVRLGEKAQLERRSNQL